MPQVQCLSLQKPPPHGRPTTYLCDEEVHVILDKHLQLLLEDVLDLGVTLAAQVGGGLGDAPCHQSTPLVGHLPGQFAGSLVDLRSLWDKKTQTKAEHTLAAAKFKPLCPWSAAGEEAGGFRWNAGPSSRSP